ncbi:pili assembly chaperone [Pseudomonas synxantha]|jgi:conjugative transfer region protein (TIGR03748 family)|nr:pili assembly chaperone [Pseudomonas synxantha]
MPDPHAGLNSSNWACIMTPSPSLGIVLLMSCAVSTGCTSPLPAPAENSTTEVQPLPPATPVIRAGRYTLVEFRPEQAQQALLEQVIDVTLPSGWDLTVGNALRYVLRFSGYRLGDDCPDSAELYDLPLPAVHLRLGPMPLQAALQTLVGPTWKLQTDNGKRRICFSPVTPLEQTP